MLAAARELQPRAIILLMTGYPRIEGAVSAIKAGALDYIRSPSTRSCSRPSCRARCRSARSGGPTSSSPT